ncbi:MAG: hypothetical protein ABI783_06510 [Actinomycetota bacterium]
MSSKCAVLITVLELAALGATSADAVAPSGLRGLVTRSPIVPVCMEGVPCSAPAKNTPLVFSRIGISVRTRTDGTGHYRVTLAPGWWNVRTIRPLQIGSGISPSRIRVFDARYRVVNLDIDTGIR